MRLRHLASEPYKRVCCRSGSLQGVAVESGLKVLELTAGRILTMAESAMGLRHGPMAALDKTTLLVAFLASDEKVARYEKDVLQELMQKRLVRTQFAVGGRSERVGWFRRALSLAKHSHSGAGRLSSASRRLVRSAPGLIFLPAL